MDEKKTNEQEELDPEIMEGEAPEFELPKARIAYVMLIVAILCGGNGAGIVAAGLFWKRTASLAGAIAIVAACTAAALVIVAVVVLIHKGRVKKKLDEQRAREEEE